MPNGVEFAGRYAHVGTFPIGIDPQSFLDVSDWCMTIVNVLIFVLLRI